VVHAADWSNVDTVLVGGVVRKRAGKLIDIDEKRLRDAVIESITHIFSSAGYKRNPLEDQFAAPSVDSSLTWKRV
jgi:5-methylthioadenosine/S-adenosylhomocysteine deaminase